MGLIYLHQDPSQLKMPHMAQYKGERSMIMFLFLKNIKASLLTIPQNQYLTRLELGKESRYNHPLPLVTQHLHRHRHLFPGIRELGGPIVS